MAKSTDYDELTRVWKDWRDATGKKMKGNYVEFVKLSNTAVWELGDALEDNALVAHVTMDQSFK